MYRGNQTVETIGEMIYLLFFVSPVHNTYKLIEI